MIDWLFYGFIVIFIIGLLMIFVSYFFDTDDGVELSPVSPTMLAVYAVAFGSLGATLRTFTEMTEIWLIVLAFVISFVPYGITYFGLSLFMDSAGSNSVSTPSDVHEGYVTVAINPPFIGQITYVTNGYRASARAISDTPIAVGTKVRIISHGTIIKVEEHN